MFLVPACAGQQNKKSKKKSLGEAGSHSELEQKLLEKQAGVPFLAPKMFLELFFFNLFFWFQNSGTQFVTFPKMEGIRNNKPFWHAPTFRVEKMPNQRARFTREKKEIPSLQHCFYFFFMKANVVGMVFLRLWGRF